jgi:hypothetical protein
LELTDSDSSLEYILQDADGGDDVGEGRGTRTCNVPQELNSSASTSTRKRRYKSYLHDISTMPQRLKVQALSSTSIHSGASETVSFSNSPTFQEPVGWLDDLIDVVYGEEDMAAESSPSYGETHSNLDGEGRWGVASEAESELSHWPSDGDDPQLPSDISSNNLSETEEVLNSDGASDVSWPEVAPNDTSSRNMSESEDALNSDGASDVSWPDVGGCQPDNSAETPLFPGKCVLTIKSDRSPYPCMNRISAITM